MSDRTMNRSAGLTSNALQAAGVSPVSRAGTGTAEAASHPVREFLFSGLWRSGEALPIVPGAD
jgi:hypothetical protein